MIFYFDHAGNQQIGRFFSGKNGHKLTHCPGQVDLPFGFPRDAIIPLGGSLVFIHCGQPSPFGAWAAYARGHTDIDFILMSTDPASLPHAEGNMHVCKYPAHELDRHLHVSAFFDCLAQGEKKWSLLLPETYPETLTAAYLLMVAKDKKIDVGLAAALGEQWDEARAQYYDVCKQHQENGGETPASWRNISEWDAKEIGKVKEKIEELFSKVASQTR